MNPENPLKNNPEINPRTNPKKAIYSFFFGGLLPVIAFTVIEEKYGTMAGIVAGMIFGLGEVVFEIVKYRKVETLTWLGNGLLLVMGIASLYLNDGIWFKLQPAVFEYLFVFLFWGSLIVKKPLLLWLSKKQNQSMPEFLIPFIKGLTFRMGLFFLINAGLTTWAAYDWSTTNWALLKGLGFTLAFISYMILEMIGIRLRIKSKQNKRP